MIFSLCFSIFLSLFLTLKSIQTYILKKEKEIRDMQEQEKEDFKKRE